MESMLPVACGLTAALTVMFAMASRPTSLDRLERCWAGFSGDNVLVRRGGRIAEISPTHYRVRDLSQGARLGDIVEHRADTVDQRRGAVLADRVEVDLDQRAATTLGDRHHRMEHGPDRIAPIGHLTHDAVDEEGLVVLDDLEKVALEIAPVGADPAPNADQRLTVRLFAEAPELGQRRADFGGPGVGQLVGGAVAVRLLQELPRGLGQAFKPERAGEGVGEGAEVAGLAGRVKACAFHGVSRR